ncbi:MAG TPA: alpha-amylase family glycosyl hydrolase [Isosphaeraceae bacterium]|nr:alpha-amylase family glycosyl hydrolase [Isosphaeraceae bacterium]
MRRRHSARQAVLLLGVLAQTWTTAAQVVETIEPPSWWVERDEQELLLLIEGSGLEGAEVRVARGPIRLARIEPGRQGRTLFVHVTVPGDAQASPCEFEIAAGGKILRRRWELVPRPARHPEPFGPDDVLYLVMPDRFANGDPANDEPPGGDRMLDRHDTHAYHGGDFAGIRRRLPNLADLGVTAVWLTPVYRQATTWFAANLAGAPRKMADFHGYSPVDVYQTNPRFGSLSEYRALVDEAHRLGLKVIQDHVLGHTGPQHRWVVHPPSADWFHGPLDRPPLCTFRFEALTNPHAREADRRGVTDGWFAGILPDLNMRDPRVARYAIQQSLWWITLFEADGVRLDTYPMTDRAFWRDWSRRLKATHPGIRAVGEAWVTDAADLSVFQGGRAGWDGINPGVDAVFDFPMYQAATAVFSGRAPASALAQVLRRDGLYPRPDLLVTFLDNHDTPRLAAVEGVTPARLRLAIVFLLTTRGIPQITWGDEIGLPGHMDDRRDFPGGFPGDARNAFTAAGRTPTEQSIFATYRDLLRLRKSSPALRRGVLTNLTVNETVYAYLRQYGAERMVIALNLGKTPAEVTLPPELSGAAERLHGAAGWSDGPTGSRLGLPGESAAIVRLAEPNPSRDGAAGTVP